MSLQIVELRIAMEAGGSRDRGIVDGSDFEEMIRDRMVLEGVPEDRYSDVETLAFAFANFAQHVRAAALKERPVIPYIGETLPKRG